jgi:hypothetical protein
VRLDALDLRGGEVELVQRVRQHREEREAILVVLLQLTVEEAGSGVRVQRRLEVHMIETHQVIVADFALCR